MTANRRRLRLIPAALVLGATACAAGDDTDTSATTVTQSGDTTIVVPALNGPTGRLVSDLVLGEDDSNPDAIFGRIAAAALAPDGRIYVIEMQTQTVHVYAPTGEALPRLTRQGEGPGEVRSARELVVREDGSVLVREVGDGFEVFDAEGTHLGTWDVGWGPGPDVQVGASGGVMVYSGMALRVNGQPWLVGPEEIYSAGMMPNLGDQPTGRIYRIDSNGTRVDSVPSPVLGSDVLCLGGDNPRVYCIGITLGPMPWIAIAHDGAIWSGRTERYHLDRHAGLSRDASPLTSIRPTREPFRIDDALRDALDGRIREMFAAQPGFDEIYPIPTQKPAIARVFPTRDGTLWARLHAPSERTLDAEGEEIWVETESRFDIFTPEGEHVGYVTGPAEMWIEDIRGDTVLATRVGAYGVPYVERFLIDWSDPN